MKVLEQWAGLLSHSAEYGQADFWPLFRWIRDFGGLQIHSIVCAVNNTHPWAQVLLYLFVGLPHDVLVGVFVQATPQDVLSLRMVSLKNKMRGEDDQY